MKTAPRDWQALVGVTIGCLLAGALGWLAPQHPVLALAAAAAVLLVGISALHTAAIPLLALPLLYVPVRLNVGASDLSVSDAALGLATLAAVVFAPRPLSRELRTLMWLVAVYQVATLFTVVANPYTANTIEWVHAGVLVAGALLVGWAVGRTGHARLGLRLMLVAAVTMATWVIVVGLLQAVRGDFQPVYLPNGFHKNFMGTVMGTTALIAYIRPAWLGMRRRIALPVFWWLAIGIGFTQSRQAIVALGIALCILVLRTRTDRRRSKVVLLAVVPAFVIVLTLVRDQFASGNEHNSFFTRLSWFREALDIWQTQPLVGVGLRWWYTDRFPGGIQPPNAELEVLTSAGILGLLAFLVMVIGAVVVLWKLPPAYGALALLAVISRLVQGQLDLFWVAAQTSIPFVIAGICLGALTHAEDIRHPSDALAEALPDAGPRSPAVRTDVA